jgi:hypothetical protein
MRIPSPNRGFAADVMLVWVIMSISPQQHSTPTPLETSLVLASPYFKYSISPQNPQLTNLAHRGSSPLHHYFTTLSLSLTLLGQLQSSIDKLIIWIAIIALKKKKP